MTLCLPRTYVIPLKPGGYYMYQQVYRSEILHAARTFPVCILYLYFEQRLLLTQR